MDYSIESPLVAAQRNAIQQIRGRYERGDLPFDAFREGLDALTKATSPEECAAILRDLPPAPLAVLAALEPRPALAPTAARPVMPARSTVAPRHITAFMSETRKTRNNWTLTPETRVRTTMGAIRLDLRKAQLPEYAHMKVKVTMGEVVIYVPDDVEVVVRASAIMGEVQALGESIEGMVTSGQEEYTPVGVLPRAHVEIDVRALMGSVRIELVGANAIPDIADFARETLRGALEGLRRGWEQSARDAQIPAPTNQPGLPSGLTD